MDSNDYGKESECSDCQHTAALHASIYPHPCVGSPRCRCIGFVWQKPLHDVLFGVDPAPADSEPAPEVDYHVALFTSTGVDVESDDPPPTA